MAKGNIEAIYRLSPMQEGILYHVLEAARPGVYFEQYSCDFLTDVDTGALKDAWQFVVDRHAALRTLFTWEKRDKPLQVVRERVTVPWRSVDWRATPAADVERRWQGLLRRDRDTGFDLEQAPLLRVTLVRLGDSRWRMLVSFHHLSLDGWSTRQVLAEVRTAYDARVTGRAPTLPPATGYGTFIAWLEQQDLGEATRHFETELAGYCEPARLPREPGDANAGGVRETTLDRETTAQLTRAARSHRLTLNALVLGAWSLVVARNAAADDLVVGTTMSGRPAELDGADRIVGLFINTLPLRVIVDDRATFADWLADLQRRQAATTAFQHMPLAAVQRLGDLPPGEPLFETIVVFENFPVDGGTGNATLDPVDERFVEYSNYPLALLAVPGDTLGFYAVHDGRAFGADCVDRLLGQLAALLVQAARSLETPVGDLALASDEELDRIVRRFPVSDLPLPEAPPTIDTLIVAAARANPDRPAAVDDDQSLSWRELDERSGRLAQRLAARGVGPGVFVPVLIERSVDAVAAIVGILRAGGAYVALDPAYPDDRIRHVLDDLSSGSSGGLPVVITTTGLRARLGEMHDQVLCADAGAFDAATTAVPVQRAGPDDPAYVIYTSGSSGRPKGVVVCQRNLVASTVARRTVYADAPERFLLLSSLATDSSVAGLFWTLAGGGTLVLPRPRIEQDVDALGELIRARNVTHTLCVPSLYELILENAPVAALDGLGIVVVAGEACRASVVDAHRRTLPGCELWNEYGPSEGTVWATAARLHPGDCKDAQMPSIGRPVPGARVYVVDQALRPVPVGVAGEIVIGGAGVAAGYLGRTELTRERFVPDPFVDDDGARLYRTGDLGRWRDDGRLAFAGRLDNQFKVRGHRVEPEEIEAALTEHPAIAEAAVRLDDGGPGHDAAALALALSRLPPGDAERLLAGFEGTSDGQIDSWLAPSGEETTR